MCFGNTYHPSLPSPVLSLFPLTTSFFPPRSSSIYISPDEFNVVHMVLVWDYLQENGFLNCGCTTDKPLSLHLMATDFLRAGVGTCKPFYPSNNCQPIGPLGMGSRQLTDRQGLWRRAFAGNNNLCGIRSETVMSCSKDSVLPHFAPFCDSYILSGSSSVMSLETWRGGYRSPTYGWAFFAVPNS